MPTLSQLSNKPRKTLADLAAMHSKEKGAIDPDAIRAEVEAMKRKGLIIEPGKARPVEKNGIDAASLGAVRSQWIDVTPAMAKKWLENNFVNRRVDDDTVKAYARDMINGVWVATHQGVAFNDKDELIDGQHRLYAIILAKKTIRMMVTFGLPCEIKDAEMTTMDAVDRGRTRSVADQLRIQHNMPNGGIIAQICSSLGGLCYGLRTKRLSVGQTLDIYGLFRGAIDWVIVHKSKESGLKGAGVLTAFAFALALDGEFWGKHDTCLVARMYESLVNGDPAKETPIARLRAFLTSEDAVLLTRSTNRGVAELTLQAIFLEAKGKKIAKLEMGTEGLEHFKSRQPERVEKVAAMFRLPDAKAQK